MRTKDPIRGKHEPVADFNQDFPIVLSLRRFSSTDIYTFLTKWPFKVDTKAENIIRLYNELSDKPALREMCTNPLVLSMYVAQDQSGENVIAPETRTDFYKLVTDELVIKRRIIQTRQGSNQTVIKSRRYKVLGAIAFHHMMDRSQAANNIDWRKSRRF